MVGYTLSYLSGYERAAQQPHAAGTPTDQMILTALALTSLEQAQDVSTHADTPTIAGFINQRFYEQTVDQFYSITTTVPVPAGENLSNIRDFLIGYNQGGIEAADVVYGEVFSLGYGIGYSDGFADGYAKGYAEGYRIGYSAGWSAGWNAAPKGFWVGFGGFFDGVTKFIGEAAHDAGPIVSAVEAIASLF
jgi:hypothetical protein